MMQQRFRTGGLAAWSIRHPVGVSMLALAVVVLGVFSLDRLAIDLLPHLIYPEVRVRIIDPGVPAQIMEDRVTRQLEEQLAITENAISVQSTTTEGRSNVDLTFPYGTDIDIALRDASTRLDRAKRFLPDTIDPPIIYKRDPSQIPILELAVSSDQRESAALRDWVDYEFSNWFLNLPGVASTEVGGGNVRELQILIDQERLANLGLSFEDIAMAITEENQESPGGRLNLAGRELSTRAAGRFHRFEELAQLPVWNPATLQADKIVRIRDVARVVDGHEDERLRIRLNTVSGIKLSIQKQPQANTVAVVEAINQQLQWLKAQNLIPSDISIRSVSDQSIYVRHSLNNASIAVISGAILAMLVVYLFLGNLQRTLIIGTAIPLAIFVTFTIMALGGLTLNIMTLGGLALGVGMLVDNTIVMLENITRHQRLGESNLEAPINAAREVNSAIVASTTTNLAAILPFLFIGGLIGLLFSEMIFTLSAAIMASLVVALTLVPALGARVKAPPAQATLSGLQHVSNTAFERLQRNYVRLVNYFLQHPWRPVLFLAPFLIASFFLFITGKQIFLPQMDEGNIMIRVTADASTRLNDMDNTVRQLEAMLLQQPEVETVFTTAGGFVFGRSAYQASNRSGITVQLVPVTQRKLSSEQWIKKINAKITQLNLVGYRFRIRVSGIRGIRLGSSDDDVSIRIQGDDLDTLGRLGDEVVSRIKSVPGLRNLEQSYEEIREELVININRERAADLGIRVSDIGRALQIALDGLVVSDFIDGDRQYDIRLRLPRHVVTTPDELANVLVGVHEGQAIRMRDVADIKLALTPSSIKRDNQRRIVEISASLTGDATLDEVMENVEQQLEGFEVPAGYSLYDGGSRKQLQQGRKMGYILLALALFLVFVVMAVQYESLRNPLVIILGIPFTSIGVAAALVGLNIQLSMPVWLGLIMLAGIVVNNAIILVEQIEIERESGKDIHSAIVEAAKHRLRPILMTALTTVVGMSPLALGLGEGSEMLQPLAIVIVSGLIFSTLISLVLIPNIYLLLRRHKVASSGS